MNHNLGNSFKISIYEDDVHRQLLKEHTITSLTEKITQMETNLEKIINENVNNNMMAANNHIKEIEEHLFHADQRIKFLDDENANLRKNIEDNKDCADLSKGGAAAKNKDQ